MVVTKQTVKRLAAGYYHVTNEAGKFWIARVWYGSDAFNKKWEWQVGEVAADGFEDPPFDAASTMSECLDYCTAPT